MTLRTPSDHIFDRLVRIADKKTKMFSGIWERDRAEFGVDWATELVDSVVHLFGPEAESEWESAIIGYADFALDATRNQRYFETNGHYRWSSAKDLEDQFYTDEVHMMDRYLPGLYLSHYLWPHHYRLLTFFRDHVLPELSPDLAEIYDIGPGTGIYSRITLETFNDIHGTGIDISAHSIAFTRKVLNAFGLDERYSYITGDVTTIDLPYGIADFTICQEVLEHVEDPERLCQRLHNITRAGGKAYITAAINAAHSDHIYLFRSPDEVRQLLESTGWKIIQSRAEYAYESDSAESIPCVAGYFCEPR